MKSKADRLCWAQVASTVQMRSHQRRPASPRVTYYTEYVYHVLELHLSVARNDLERVKEIARRLKNAQEQDATVAKVIDALRRRDFSTARSYELKLLLRIAA